MDRKEKLEYCYLSLLLPIGTAAVIWAVYGFPVESIGLGLITLSVVTIFFSSYFRIQLPRTKIHLTTSDAMIILSMLLYGGQVAVILVVLETAFTSINFRRQGVSIRLRTIFLNVLIAAIAVFATAGVVRLIFGSTQGVMNSGDITRFIWLLAVISASLFILNSLGVSAIIAARSGRSVLNVWNEYCVNGLVMYFSGALMAGFVAKAIEQINAFLFVAVVGFFGLVYFTYRRYIDDIKRTAALAEQAERQRAEQAESHVKELKHYVVQLEQSSQALEQSHERFRHAVYHDALTGLPNRNYFADKISELLTNNTLNPDNKFAVLLLDLNRFKTINDSLGHSLGDELIRNVAKRISKLADTNEIVGRFGGDEFAVIMPEIRDLTEATAFADRVAKRVAESYSLHGREVFTSVSIGIAFGCPTYRRADDVLRDADIAMYYAKDNEENYVIFDENMHTKAVSLLQLETDLRHAIENNEMELYYQPIVNLNDVSLSGFEALVRWNHPKRGLVPPNEFISVSEYTGLIIPMTLQILRTACLQLVEWQKRFPSSEPLTVAVNLSGKHFSHPELVQQIGAILEETSIAPESLKLEITESAVMENAEDAIAMLKAIRALGVQLCIDDFGTGHSSLSYLQRFPVDTLKVDRSFVKAMEDGSENSEIVRAVIALGKILKLNVVAEGIESINHFHQLRVLECKYGQGYLFSRPLPVPEIDRMLKEGSNWQYFLHGPDFQPGVRENGYSESNFTN